MNDYLSDLVGSLTERYSVEAEGMTTAQWMQANTTYRGEPFSFSGYNFQEAITNDLHPNLDVIKLSQVGLTEVQIRKMLALLIRNPGITGIFSLPNEIMYKRFSQSRLKPLVEENKVFNSGMDKDSVRSMGLMQFGRSFLHVVNATEGSATSISADAVFTDEVDLSDQKILALFASRLQNSTYKIKQRFSTPSWTGYGIDATYGVSDQREYYCKCSACNHWQVPLWDKRWVSIPGLSLDTELVDIDDEIFEKLDIASSQVVCEKCSCPLDLDNPKREWIATHPTRTNGRGYRVRPFSSCRIDIPYILAQLLDYKRKDFIRGWYNTVIGEPYMDARARLDEGQIRACMDTPRVVEISSDTPVFMGIDMGATCHITLGRKEGETEHVFEFRSVPVREIIDTVREINIQYNLVGGCCDRHPYTPTADEIRDVTDGKVMPLEYRGDPELKPVESVEKIVTHWQCNRTKLIDEVARRIRLRGYVFSGFGHQAGVITEHLRDMIRDESPEKAARWIKLTGNDHYFHSLAFLSGAMKMVSVAANISGSETRSLIMLTNIKIPQPTGLLQKKPDYVKAKSLY